MTKQEAAIISTYTGFLLGSFSDMHKYHERIMGRPVYTHELAEDELVAELKAKSRPDFIALQVK